MITYGLLAGAVIYGAYTTYRLCTGGCSKKGRCNTDIRLSEEKIVHSFDIEDLDSKNVYCRCWKSKKVSFFFLSSKIIFRPLFIVIYLKLFFFYHH